MVIINLGKLGYNWLKNALLNRLQFGTPHW